LDEYIEKSDVVVMGPGLMVQLLDFSHKMMAKALDFWKTE
jgi:hypothetical protein